MHRVLVLDSFYQPARVVDWQTAVCGIYSGKLEMIEHTDEVLRSPSMQMQMPSIVRSLRKRRSRKVSIRFSRTNVLLRDGHRCMYCGRAFDPHELNYDHVVPRSRGGRTDWENIVAACYACNARKGDRTPEEAKMPLLTHPRKPVWLPVVPKKLDLRTVPESWKSYFGQAA